MQATKKAQYALRGVLFLAKEKKVCSLRSVAEKEDISFDYLEKIFSKLEKKGVVKSKRGAMGGYILSRAPGKITLKDVFDAVEEQISIVNCIEKHCPRDSSCKASKAWKKVNKEIKSSLSAIKLSDLLK